MATSQQIASAESLAAYLLRGLRHRIDFDRIQANRRRNLSRELADFLVPAAVSSRSTEEWVRVICHRFEIEPTGQGWVGDGGQEFAGRPAYALIPRKFLPTGTITIEDHPQATSEVAAVRWDCLTRQIDFGALRIAIARNPSLTVTFAMNPPTDGEDSLFASCVAADARVAPWSPQLPKRLQTPRAYRTIVTLTSKCGHGADHKSGNVTMFRRERAVDPVTGETYWRPFLSGNAWRGVWRDEMAGITCRDVGLQLHDLDAKVAHALLSGGTISAGADGGSADVTYRRMVRGLLPGWDLFAGVISEQLMRGVIRVHDSHLICRENAWMLYDLLDPHRPGSEERMPYDEFVASLKPADEFTELRLLTRHAHRDIDQCDGIQMLTETEYLLAGAQLIHSFQLVDLDGVSSLSKSFLARLLREFRDNAFVGAGNARGFGAIAFDPYEAGDDALKLPSEDEYVAYVEANRDAIRSFLLGDRGGASASAGSPAKGKGGRGKKAAVQTPADEATQQRLEGTF